MKTKEIAFTGLMIALSMILSYVESLIPAFVAIPGIKVGLANIVVVFALYIKDAKHALLISIIRVILSSLLFGSVLALSYSLAGALLSWLGMVLLKKVFSTVGVSVCGGVLHNIGQILMACIILRTKAIIYYTPFLILSGTITGLVIGLVSSIIIKRITQKEN